MSLCSAEGFEGIGFLSLTKLIIPCDWTQRKMQVKIDVRFCLLRVANEGPYLY